MTYYERCTGRDLPPCETCRRNIENPPIADMSQARWIPQTRGEQCADFMVPVGSAPRTGNA